MIEVTNKDIKKTSVTSFWFLYCYLGTYLTPLSAVFIPDFEQLNTYQALLNIFNAFIKSGFQVSEDGSTDDIPFFTTKSD